MDSYIPFLLSFVSGISTMIGSIFIFLRIKRVEEFTILSLSFSMTTMILISIFDLLPSSIPIIIKNYNLIIGLIISLLVFFLGYLSIYVISNKINTNKSLYKIGILSFISLLLHNIPEGIAVFMSAYNNIKIGFKMCFSIMCHNIPEGIQISVPLYYSGESRGRVVLLTLISSLAEPIGALLSYVFLKDYFNELFISFILIFVSGLMISLSVNEIYNEIKYYNLKIYKIIGILIAIILSTIIFLI